MMDDLSPSAHVLKERAAHYRRLAAKERDPAKAAGYHERAGILDRAAEPVPYSPAEQADLEEAERHVRGGELRVERQGALIERLDASDRHDEAETPASYLLCLSKILAPQSGIL